MGRPWGKDAWWPIVKVDLLLWPRAWKQISRWTVKEVQEHHKGHTEEIQYWPCYLGRHGANRADCWQTVRSGVAHLEESRNAAAEKKCTSCHLCKQQLAAPGLINDDYICDVCGRHRHSRKGLSMATITPTSLRLYISDGDKSSSAHWTSRKRRLIQVKGINTAESLRRPEALKHLFFQ